jgi:hypothetical protein
LAVQATASKTIAIVDRTCPSVFRFLLILDGGRSSATKEADVSVPGTLRIGSSPISRW